VRTLTDEARLFARMSIFGLGTGAAYWILTSERAGTILLLAFGLGAGLAAVAIFVGSRGGRRRAREAPLEAPPEAGPEDSPALAAEVEPLPEPGWAPLGIAAGIGGLALGAAFGPWLTIAGLILAIVGALSWLSAAVRETDAARGRPPR